MEFQNLLELIDHVSDSGLTSFEYEEQNLFIKMKADNRKIEMVEGVVKNTPIERSHSNETIVSQEAKASVIKDEKLVKSPLVGVFYTAPSEDAEAFVKVGDTVSKGQTLGIVEAMKLMNEIECDYDGVVAQILVENMQSVEYGQPLFRIQ